MSVSASPPAGCCSDTGLTPRDNAGAHQCHRHVQARAGREFHVQEYAHPGCDAMADFRLGVGGLHVRWWQPSLTRTARAATSDAPWMPPHLAALWERLNRPTYDDAPLSCDAPHLTPHADPSGITGQPLKRVA